MESLPEIKCPICLQNIELDINSETAFCKNCNKSFYFITCSKCFQNIYFTKKYIEGYNIQCPYLSCGGIKCHVICEKCNKKIFFTENYCQGDIIECENCKYQFKKIKCPCLNCNNNIITSLNFREGSSIECNNIQNHDGKIFKFQKINCCHCGKNCVWDNTKNKYYIEGQIIKCPNKNCEKISNKVICPKCKKSGAVMKGNLDMGRKIVCFSKKCDCVYSIYFCPFCKKINYGNGTSITGKELICTECKQKFSFVNCIYCKQINFWKNPNFFIEGQNIICQDENCQKIFSLIRCPHCLKINYFGKGLILLGKNYECCNNICRKGFIVFFCGLCNKTNIKKVNPNNNIYLCDYCNNPMPVLQCPKCFKFCKLENKTNLIIPMLSNLKCPYNSCGATFFYYKCPFCKRDFNHDVFISTNIKCPFTNCQKIFSYNFCNKCGFENIIENKENDMDIEENICEKCGEKILFDEKNNKNINLSKVNITQGEAYFFDNPDEDPYDTEISESMVWSKIYEIPPKIKNENEDDNINMECNKCVICLDKPKVSVFVPCGHRCVCFECGTRYQNEFKKCPLCKENSLELLKEVIDDD